VGNYIYRERIYIYIYIEIEKYIYVDLYIKKHEEKVR